MSTNDLWNDFDTIKNSVRRNTVDRLKHIVGRLNNECYAHISKTGRKQELISRIENQMDIWRMNRQEDLWRKGKAIVSQPFGTPPSYDYPPPPVTQSAPNRARAYASLPSHIPRFDPYAPPRRAGVSGVPPAASTTSSASHNIRFRSSPFFRIQSQVSTVVECPESISSSDRKNQHFTFQLTTDQTQKLSSTTESYQLRLFCTSSHFYSPHTFRPTSGPCPIEFPPTCEVRINALAVPANLKGMKKKPGTTPPADITKLTRSMLNGVHKVEMVYVNAQTPILGKKYYLVVMLVQTTTVKQLMDNLLKNKYKSGNEIREKMRIASSQDDDIVAGAQKMSLKCPLTTLRVNTPCRSIHCVHPQCFDGESWLMVNEQTTTWMCPVCEKALNFDDIIVDGYFDEIVKAVPEDVEDVIVETDGEWHTSDNIYGSPAWKASHPTSVAAPPPPRPNPKPISRSSDSADEKGKARASDAEVFVLDDSDEEEESFVKRELSPSYGGALSAQASYASLPPQSQPVPERSTTVIDLTLSDDEDDPPPAPRAPHSHLPPTHAELGAGARHTSMSTSLQQALYNSLKRKADDLGGSGEDDQHGDRPYQRPRIVSNGIDCTAGSSGVGMGGISGGGGGEGSHSGGGTTTTGTVATTPSGAQHHPGASSSSEATSSGLNGYGSHYVPRSNDTQMGSPLSSPSSLSNGVSGRLPLPLGVSSSQQQGQQQQGHRRQGSGGSGDGSNGEDRAITTSTSPSSSSTIPTARQSDFTSISTSSPNHSPSAASPNRSLDPRQRFRPFGPYSPKSNTNERYEGSGNRNGASSSSSSSYLLPTLDTLRSPSSSHTASHSHSAPPPNSPSLPSPRSNPVNLHNPTPSHNPSTSPLSPAPPRFTTKPSQPPAQAPRQSPQFTGSRYPITDQLSWTPPFLATLSGSSTSTSTSTGASASGSGSSNGLQKHALPSRPAYPRGVDDRHEQQSSAWAPRSPKFGDRPGGPKVGSSRANGYSGGGVPSSPLSAPSSPPTSARSTGGFERFSMGSSGYGQVHGGSAFGGGRGSRGMNSGSSNGVESRRGSDGSEHSGASASLSPTGLHDGERGQGLTGRFSSWR